MMASARKPAASYVDAVKSIRPAILTKVFPEQILPLKEQGIVVNIVLMNMCEGWYKEFVFTGIRFQPWLILVN